MLAHNAAVLGVPFDMTRLLHAGVHDPYVEALGIVVDAVGRTHEKAKNKRP